MARDCVSLALSIGKKILTPAAARQMVENLANAAAEARGKYFGDLAQVEQEMVSAAKRAADLAEREALQEKRRIIRNAIVERGADEHVQRFRAAGMTRFDGLKAYLVGSNRVVKGALMSLEAQQRREWSNLLGMLNGNLKKLGDAHFKMFTNPAAGVGRKIAQELFEIDASGKVGISGDETAASIAKAVSEVQEIARRKMNDAGADVGKLPGYIVMQEHDPNAMLGSGYKEWRDHTLPLVDIRKTVGSFESEAIERMMQAVYRNITLGTESELLKDLPEGQTVFMGEGENITNRIEQHRTIHFKDGGAWFDYNERYGKRFLHEAVIAGLERAGKNVAMLKNMGENPEAMLTKLVNKYQQEIRMDVNLDEKVKAKELGHWKSNELTNYLKHLSGKYSRPESPTAANIGAGIRTFQSLRLLGKVLFSQFSDPANMLAELRYQGAGPLDRWQRLFSERANVTKAGENTQMYDYLGTAVDQMLGGSLSRVHANDGAPGTASRLLRTFFKMNGSMWWDDTWNKAMGAVTSRWLADHAHLDHANLPPALKRLIGQYGIDEHEWSVLRQAVTELPDGRKYLTGEAVRNLPDKVIKEWWQNGGRNRNQEFLPLPGQEGAAARLVAHARDELQGRLETLITNRATYGILRPGARTQRWTTWNLPRGDAMGEVARMMMQFKSWSLATYEKSIERELYGYGANSLKQSLLDGKGAMLGLAHYLALCSAFGYISMSAKDALRGLKPRDPTDPRTWMASALQGGGLGIYGDFLFGETSRYGNSMWANLLGPSVGTVEDVKNLWDGIRTGDEKASQVFRFAINNMPFANLYYTRTALDYLILYDFQEMLNPGGLRRMEGNIKKNNGQEFFLKPSQSRARPFTG